MVGLTEKVDDRIRCRDDLDIRARYSKTGDAEEWRLITGSGAPTSATGTLAESGSIYVDISGTGDLYIKSSRTAGAWSKIINHVS